MKNLPLEYSKLSNFYDALCGRDDEDSRNAPVEKILKIHSVQTVLDMTCGTGSQVIWLAKRGYKVTGSDISSNLLKIAKNKARKEKINALFSKGDMRYLRVGSFDAVITIFNAVGHLSKTGFEKAMRNIHKNLATGGIYVFDIFNLSSMKTTMLESMSMDNSKTVGTTTIRNIQHSELDAKKGHLVSHDHFFIQKNGRKPSTLRGTFALQIYTAQELREMLMRNGFKILSQSSMDGTEFSETTTQAILTVAQKV